MRIIFLISAFLLISFCSFPQGKAKSDSLKAELKKELTDTLRIKVLNKLSWELKYQNPDSSFYLASQALSIIDVTQRGVEVSAATKQTLNKLSANTHSNLGVYCSIKGNDHLSLSHHFKALEIRKTQKDKKGISSSIGNIGIAYSSQGDYPKALEYYFKALKMNEEMENKAGIAANLGSIGIVYEDQGNYPKALEYYFKALKIEEELGRKSGILVKLGNIGSILTQIGRFNEAEVYLDSALALGGNIGALNYNMNFEKAISELYDTTARYKQALTHYKKYTTTKDSLFNEEKAKDIGRLEQKHETEMTMLQEEQIKNEELRIQNEKIARRNSLQYSGIVIGLLLIIILIPLLRGVGGVSIRSIEAIIFIAFMIFFEFLLVLLDPTIENWSGGEPLWKLVVNALLAATIFPLHSFFEGKVKKRMLKTQRTQRSDPSQGSDRSVGGKTLSLFIGLAFVLGINSGFENKTDVSIVVLTKVDSLKAELKKDLSDTTRIKVLIKLGWKLKYQNSDTSVVLSQQALKLAIALPSSVGVTPGVRSKLIANSYSDLGAYYWIKGDYTFSLSQHFKALEIRETQKDQRGIVATLGNIGLVYSYQGNYPKALEYYFRALKIAGELEDKTKIAIQLGNIGIVYLSQRDYSKALEYYFEALRTNEELGNNEFMADNLGNIGLVYWNQADYPKTLEYFFKALKIMEEEGNSNGIATILGNIGSTYHNQQNYPKALEYYFKALKMRRSLGAKNLIAGALGNIGSLYAQLGRFAEAERYLDSSLTLCKSIGALNHTMNFEKSLSSLYDSTARYKQALIHYKKYTTAKDSLFNEEKSKDIGRLEQRHETEMAELKRAQEEEEKSRHLQLAVSRRNQLQYSGIVLGLGALFLGIFIGARRIRKIKAHKTHGQYVKIMEGALFISFLIFFEFMLVLLDNYIEQFTGGEPLYKLLINALLAGAIFPLHSFLEAKLKGRVIKTERESMNLNQE